MAYLHDRNIIHCDLALRNLLVSSSSDRKYLVKVADFGMSKTISNTSLYSRVDDNGALPIKWTAIEVLVSKILRKFSKIYCKILLYLLT